MKYLTFVFLSLISINSLCANFEYGQILISEIRSKSEMNLVVRADLFTGNYFFCKKNQKESVSRSFDGLYAMCLAELFKNFPKQDFSGQLNRVIYYEPIILTVFGQQGWEVYDYNQEVIENGTFYSTNTTFKITKQIRE